MPVSTSIKEEARQIHDSGKLDLCSAVSRTNPTFIQSTGSDTTPQNHTWENLRGAHKWGLKPQIFRENRGEILPAKSGLFGANWDLFRAYRGLFGADRDQFLRTPQPRGKSRNCPERALFGLIGAFRAKPPFAKPPFGFLPKPHRPTHNFRGIRSWTRGVTRHPSRQCSPMACAFPSWFGWSTHQPWISVLWP